MTRMSSLSGSQSRLWNALLLSPHANDADSMLTTGVGVADVMDANWMLVFLPTLTNILPRNETTLNHLAARKRRKTLYLPIFPHFLTQGASTCPGPTSPRVERRLVCTSWISPSNLMAKELDTVFYSLMRWIIYNLPGVKTRAESLTPPAPIYALSANI